MVLLNKYYMYKANVYRVMIASPGDVQEEREIARKIIYEWNTLHSSHRKIVLLPLLWEYNATPASGGRAQGIINDQVLQHADLLIGIFWMRIGSNTGKAISGTVEELETHVENGKPAMLYFSTAPLPQAHDREQFEALQKFKAEALKNNLCAFYHSNSDFEAQFRNHLAQKMNESKIFSNYEEVPAGVVNGIIAASSMDLPDEAKVLLVAAAQSRNGMIMQVHSKAGLSIQINNKQFVTDQSPRIVAKWKGAIEHLIGWGLIRALSTTLYEITDMGYQKADSYLTTLKKN
jgi:hypothetical protein